MNKQIAVGVIVMIALMTIGTTSQVVQSQLQRGNDPVGGDIGEQDQLQQGNDPVGGDIVNPRELTRLRAVEQLTSPAAPIAISGDNIYIAWPTNSSGNDEVNVRTSTDGGTTFADKINLSNTTGAESQDVEIAVDGDNVIVNWWERNQTAEEPVVRISTDNAEAFGPVLKFATNGTIGQATE